MADIIGKKIIKLSYVDSTNNYATKYCSENTCPEGTIFMAECQSKGRGQRNNIWESDCGKNILMTVVLYPVFLPVQQQFILSKVVALAVSDVVKTYCSNVKIKWPNDIYVDTKKVAGILIENSITGSTLGLTVAGIGLNVNQTIFSDLLPNPVSLAKVFGCEIDVDQVLTMLFNRLDFWYMELCNGKHDFIHKTYYGRLYQVEQMCWYKDKNGTFEGYISEIDNIGRLVIIDKDKHIRKYHFKEVEFLVVGEHC